MRVSQYTIGAGLSGQPFHIMCHGLTGALDKIASPVARLLVEHRGQPVESLANFDAVVDAQTRALLLKRGYLTELDAEAERARLVQVASAIHDIDLATNATSFMFVPAYSCNLRCPYCFQDHKMHRGVDKFAAVMTRTQVDSAFAIIDDYARPGAVARALGLADSTIAVPDAIHRGEITLFGGEPLGPKTREIVPYIVAQAQERGMAMAAITNGVALDLFVDQLGEGRIANLQITLDGRRELHNRRRIGPGLHDSFDRICANIDLALDRHVSVSVRINVDTDNLSDIEWLHRHFQERGWTNRPGFSAYAATVHGTDAATSCKSVSEAALVRETIRLADTAGSQIVSYETNARNLLGACLDGGAYPFRTMAHCAAETGMLIFDCLDEVYACWEDVGTSALRIAQYGPDGLAFDVDSATEWLTRFPGAIEQCTRCPYALIHTSGCASHARKTSGTMKASACESFQAYFPETLARVYGQFEQDLFAGATDAA